MSVSFLCVLSQFNPINWSFFKNYSNLNFISDQKKIHIIGLTALTIFAGLYCCFFSSKIKQRFFSKRGGDNNLENSPPKQHLIIYFDVNGTIQFQDTKKGPSDYLLLLALSRTTHDKWGEETQIMSYKDYVEKMIPGDKSDLSIKDSRQKMTAGFLDVLKKDPKRTSAKEEALRKYDQVRECFTCSNGEVDFTIFPSFYKLLNKMREMECKFTIILRSFGGDLDSAAKRIGENAEGIRFTRSGFFENKKFTVKKKEGSEETFKTPKEIFDFFKNSNEHMSVQDNWSEWNANQESEEHGKLIPIDLSALRNKECRILAFDDNYEGGKQQDILCVRDLNGKKISEEDLLHLSTISPSPLVLNRVDPVEAATDPEYFVRLAGLV